MKDSPAAKPGRRELHFDRLDQVMPDVDRLLQEGYQTTGQWSLGQICKHLAMPLMWAIDGFPMKMPWVVRRTVGPLVYHRIAKTGKMPSGIKAPSQLQPSTDLDDRAEAEALRATIQLFTNHSGPFAENAFFGRLTREQYTRLNCIHCAHHLSFLITTSSPP